MEILHNIPVLLYDCRKSCSSNEIDVGVIQKEVANHSSECPIKEGESITVTRQCTQFVFGKPGAIILIDNLGSV